VVVVEGTPDDWDCAASLSREDMDGEGRSGKPSEALAGGAAVLVPVASPPPDEVAGPAGEAA